MARRKKKSAMRFENEIKKEKQFESKPLDYLDNY